jgi:hypothetical protein
MTPRVRLPLVEVSDATRIEIEGVLASVCEDYADGMIGTIDEGRQVALRTAAR